MDDYSYQRNRTGPRLLTRWGPTVLVLAVLAFYLYGGRAAPPPPGWGDDFAAAVAEAAASDRKIVAEFYSDGCPPCVAMSRSVLGTAAVREALTDFVPVRVDAWRDEELARRIGVVATPTYVILNTAGKVFARTEGYRSVEEFISFLKGVSASGAIEAYSVGPLRAADP